jgi:hypothetical protein
MKSHLKSADSVTISFIPQWPWTRAQCREWLRAFFIKEYGLEKGIATEHAKRFQGAGATLCLLSLDKLGDLFGDELGLLIFERVKERERQDLES